MAGATRNLTQEAREKLMTGRRTAMQDPAVTAAKEQAQQAAKNFHHAMNAATLKADPTIKPILDKLPKGHRHPGLGEEQ